MNRKNRCRLVCGSHVPPSHVCHLDNSGIAQLRDLLAESINMGGSLGISGQNAGQALVFLHPRPVTLLSCLLRYHFLFGMLSRLLLCPGKKGLFGHVSRSNPRPGRSTYRSSCPHLAQCSRHFWGRIGQDLPKEAHKL